MTTSLDTLRANPTTTKGENDMSTYTTRDEAIDREIIEAIEASGVATRDEYNIDAIADEVLGGYDEGYACIVDEAAFWDVVAKHAKAAE